MKTVLPDKRYSDRELKDIVAAKIPGYSLAVELLRMRKQLRTRHALADEVANWFEQGNCAPETWDVLQRAGAALRGES